MFPQTPLILCPSPPPLHSVLPLQDDKDHVSDDRGHSLVITVTITISCREVFIALFLIAFTAASDFMGVQFM